MVVSDQKTVMDYALEYIKIKNLDKKVCSARNMFLKINVTNLSR